ncbi:MAG TPA: M23 family metallopeptidase [Candidatus Babeliales bacterium]|nr:M23 family metallopeptidase [Candidatus Babeliales bacterium]
MCHMYYRRAWYALLIKAKYNFYKHLIQSSFTPQAECLISTDKQKHSLMQKITKSKITQSVADTLSPITHENTFGWPLKKGSFWISSHFGPRLKDDGRLGFHYGIDLAAIKGTHVIAARSGKILYAGYQPKYGNMVLIRHDKQFKTRYAHLNTIQVAIGDWILKGSCIGTVGDTGYIRKEGADGSHLHFEMYEYDKRVNPMQFFSKMVS